MVAVLFLEAKLYKLSNYLGVGRTKRPNAGRRNAAQARGQVASSTTIISVELIEAVDHIL
jgi:hypothetical protein